MQTEHSDSLTKGLNAETPGADGLPQPGEREFYMHLYYKSSSTGFFRGRPLRLSPFRLGV